MNIEVRLAFLEQIYQIYDNFIAKQVLACQRYCAACCTCNVVLTTLEGYKIVRHLMASGPPDWAEKALKASHQKRFQPLMTFNGMAERCIRGDDLPEECNDPAWGPCLFLSDDQCPVYALRPFGCRCMVSKQNCQKTGYADMDPLVLTVNHVCLQFIEHIDAHGFSGNLTDVLLWMASADNRQALRQNQLGIMPTGLIPNRPIKVLMIPPEHRDEIRPILGMLNNILVPIK
ncbi:MAG: hypothetical protein KKH68_07455 [Proteobacteria bacterium]|nr:hypothetical protein [Pseudomonadota bacterium]